MLHDYHKLSAYSVQRYYICASMYSFKFELFKHYYFFNSFFYPRFLLTLYICNNGMDKYKTFYSINTFSINFLQTMGTNRFLL